MWTMCVDSDRQQASSLIEQIINDTDTVLGTIWSSLASKYLLPLPTRIRLASFSEDDEDEQDELLSLEENSD
jgi:hypothetical protein